jgi:hypothetical protein
MQLGDTPLSASALLTDLISNKLDVGLLSAEDPDALSSQELPGFKRFRRAAPAGAWLLYVRNALAPRARGAISHGAVQIQLGGCAVELQPLALPALTAYPARGERKRALATLEKTPPAPRSVWLGQLGSRPDAADVAELLRRQELRDGRTGHGRMASWPAALGPLGLAREQLLVHGWLRVVSLRMDAPLVTSAGRSLRATLELTDSRCRVTN